MLKDYSQITKSNWLPLLGRW